MSKIQELSHMDGCEGISVCGKHSNFFHHLISAIVKGIQNMALNLEVTSSQSNFPAFSAYCYFWYFYFDK